MRRRRLVTVQTNRTAAGFPCEWRDVEVDDQSPVYMCLTIPEHVYMGNDNLREIYRLKPEEPKALKPDKEVQTRDDMGALRFFEKIGDAFAYADENPNVWKISWNDSDTEERVRFVREEDGSGWEYQTMEMAVDLETAPDTITVTTPIGTIDELRTGDDGITVTGTINEDVLRDHPNFFTRMKAHGVSINSDGSGTGYIEEVRTIDPDNRLLNDEQVERIRESLAEIDRAFSLGRNQYRFPEGNGGSDEVG